MLDGVAVHELLLLLHPAELEVVTTCEALPQLVAHRLSEQRCFRVGPDAGLVEILDRAGVGHDRLEQPDHAFRRDVSAALHDLGAVGSEHDRRRPAIFVVTAGQIGTRVLAWSTLSAM